MKKALLFSTIVLMLMTACGSGNKVIDQQRADAIKSLIESRQFVVMVGSMRPLSAPTTPVSQGHKMIIRDGMVTCYLPYAGSGQNVGYGASGYKAMNFSSALLDYKVEYPKPDRARITFRVDNGDDNYRFHVEVFMNGKTTIDVDPRGRDAISYSGMIHSLDLLE